ncbi:MAG TPA: family 1 glycosylhydrolase, partial [Candidatus Aquilonibacter sp.]|nr:family 1 glycosylhydrolase [Candidatus Aquilonibacter sp.]
QDRWGGWIGRDTAYAFAEYADAVSGALGDGIDTWITLNEPWVSAYLGYGWGSHAPGYRSMQLGMQASHHLLLAHGLSVPILRRNSPSRVGITLNFSPIESATDDPEDVEAAMRADVNVNLWFLEPLYRGRYHETVLPELSHAKLRVHDGDMQTIAAPIDFLGVNYYTRFLLKHGPSVDNPFGSYVELPQAERTAMGWEVHPDGFYRTLMRIHREYHPGEMIITENGAAFPDVLSSDGRVHDERRIAYYATHLEQVERAIADGAPVTGYFAWSLLDNFEWAEGYRPRFGLVYVDYETQRRIMKDSGYWYRDRIAAARSETSRPA